MNKPDVKKLVLLNLPYVFAFYFADKIAAVFRLAPGTEFIGKLTNGFAVFGTAFANPLPSFHPDVYKRQAGGHGLGGQPGRWRAGGLVKCLKREKARRRQLKDVYKRQRLGRLQSPPAVS